MTRAALPLLALMALAAAVLVVTVIWPGLAHHIGRRRRK